MTTEQTEYSETSAYKIQMPANGPEEDIQHTEHSERLKSRHNTIIMCVNAPIYNDVPTAWRHMTRFQFLLVSYTTRLTELPHVLQHLLLWQRMVASKIISMYVVPKPKYRNTKGYLKGSLSQDLREACLGVRGISEHKAICSRWFGTYNIEMAFGSGRSVKL